MNLKKTIKILWILLFIFVAVSSCDLIYRKHTDSIHTHINAAEVESIKIWGKTLKNGERIATKDEINEIVSWFNSVSDIRSNPDFQGTTEESGISILLKTKNKISIGRSGRNFEVQRYNRNGKWISYWGKQPNIEKILEEAAGE